MTQSLGSAAIAAAAGCSSFKVRHAVRIGRIPDPDILKTERAWLWSPAAAQEAIAALTVNHRKDKRPCVK